MLRILEVVTVRQISAGPVGVVKSVVSRLLTKGHNIYILSPGGYDDTASGFLDMGVHVASSIDGFSDSARCFDLVHFHGALNPRFVPIGAFCRRHHIPYIVSPHGNLMGQALNHNRLKKRVALRTLLWCQLGKATCFHALCKEEADAISALYPDARVEVIYNGIDIGGRPTEPVLVSEDKEHRVIGFLGRIDIPHKGIDLLLKGARLVTQMLLTHNVRIRIAGVFASKRDQELFENLMAGDVCEVVSYVGPKYGEEKQVFFRDCDAFIHTSRYEGMPMAILEAMAEGRACIVTRGTNMADIIVKCEGGWVTPDDPRGIADTLVQVAISDEEELQVMGSRSLGWCKEHHNWDRIANQYDSMYHLVVDSAEGT